MASFFKNRFIYMAFVGLTIAIVLNLVSPIKSTPNHIFWHDVLISIAITTLVWELNLQLNIWEDIYFPWHQKPIAHLLIRGLLTMFITAAIIYLSMTVYDVMLCKLPVPEKNTLLKISMLIGVLVSIIIHSIIVGSQLYSHWRKSLTEIEKHKAENLQAQLLNLRNQVNPHFLFNNLSVLSSLVYKDQDKAVEFIAQLSNVYRHLLDQQSPELIPLKEELHFIDSYLYLLKIRFGENLIIHQEIEERTRNFLLPPLALQLLIENAIKHNEVSIENKLHIHINSAHNSITISNNNQPRRQEESHSGTGLNNIRKRYQFFTNRQIEIADNSREFSVTLPLLNNGEAER